MRKIWFTILAAAFLLSGCGIAGHTGTENNSSDSITASVSDKESEEPYSLELIFGNGEILRKEMSLLAVPGYKYAGSRIGKYVEYKYYALQKCETNNADFLDRLFGLEPESTPKAISLAVSFAIFEDGTIYAFGEAYKADVDRENRALKVWLWRDEPYERERQYFDEGTAATIE